MQMAVETCARQVKLNTATVYIFILDPLMYNAGQQG